MAVAIDALDALAHQALAMNPALDAQVVAQREAIQVGIPRADDLAAGLAASLAGRRPGDDEDSSSEDEEDKAAIFQQQSARRLETDVAKRTVGVVLLDEDSPRYEGPLPRMRLPLFSHQLADLHCLVRREREGVVAFSEGAIRCTLQSNVTVVGDIPGAGKTTLMLALIGLDHPVHPVAVGESRNLGRAGVFYTHVDKEPHNGCSLVIIPQRLVRHWVDEIEAKTTLRYHLYRPGRLLSNQDARKLDLVLVTPSSYEGCSHLVWKRIVVDEADTLRLVGKSLRFHYWHIHLMTASYDVLATKRGGCVHGRILREFVSTVMPASMRTHDPSVPRHRRQVQHLTYYHILNRLVVRSHDDFVKASTATPNYVDETILCTAPSVVKASREFITAEVAEMLASGDVERAIVALGGKAGTQTNVMDLIRQSTERDVRNERIALATTQQLELEPRAKVDRVKRHVERLRHLEERLKEIAGRVDLLGEAECPICYDVMDGPTMLLCCNNVFCGRCLIEWFNRYLHNVCPLCKAKVNIKEQVVAVTQEEVCRGRGSEGTDEPITKPKALRVVCEYRKRVLVFASHQGALERIRDVLGAPPRGLDVLGKPPVRVEIFTGTNTSVLGRFQRGEVDVLLLDPRNTAGIAVPEADVVVLYHRMDPGLERQAIGRAQRMGRSTPLSVYRLYYQTELYLL
jgi:hypothetical protein